MEAKIKPIFIFSLPRSGSTLLQRVLGTHTGISTRSEPWILLPIVDSYKNNETYSLYGHQSSVKAVEDFYNSFEGKKTEYLQALRNLILSLYESASSKEAIYFLDKTPRYHLIVDEIFDIFPDAKFIFLWRNPVSIMSSIMETWCNGKWNLHVFKVDLFVGIENLINACRSNEEKIYSLNYEDFIANPEKKGDELFRYLELDNDSISTSDFNAVELNGIMGDKSGVKSYAKLTNEPIEKWKKMITNPIRKKWVINYLKWLGEERLGYIGYDQKELILEIKNISFGFKYIFSDIIRILYGVIFCLFDPKILKDKILTHKPWRKIYQHR